jgi:tetratricopeptide (TPR) repeat protein
MELDVRARITRAELLRERGEYDAALAILEPLVASLEPEDHLFRQYGASAAAQAALEAYRYELAVRLARIGIDDGRDPETRILLPWLRCQRVLGLAEDALGRPADAAARLEQAIELAESRDCPVLAGELHEARARVAFAAGDRALFEVHRARCADWLRPTENPGLIAVVERLAELDRATTLGPVDPRRRRPGATTTGSTVDSDAPEDAPTLVGGGSTRTHTADSRSEAETLVEGFDQPTAASPPRVRAVPQTSDDAPIVTAGTPPDPDDPSVPR